MFTVKVSSEVLSLAVFECSARELTPEDDREIVRARDGRWIYPDATAPNGEGYPVRMLTGKEWITVTIERGAITAIECADPVVTERFGKPGHGLFGARRARAAAQTLIASFGL